MVLTRWGWGKLHNQLDIVRDARNGMTREITWQHRRGSKLLGVRNIFTIDDPPWADRQWYLLKMEYGAANALLYVTHGRCVGACSLAFQISSWLATMWSRLGAIFFLIASFRWPMVLSRVISTGKTFPTSFPRIEQKNEISSPMMLSVSRRSKHVTTSMVAAGPVPGSDTSGRCDRLQYKGRRAPGVDVQLLTAEHWRYPSAWGTKKLDLLFGELKLSRLVPLVRAGTLWRKARSMILRWSSSGRRV